MNQHTKSKIIEDELFDKTLADTFHQVAASTMPLKKEEQMAHTGQRNKKNDSTTPDPESSHTKYNYKTINDAFVDMVKAQAKIKKEITSCLNSISDEDLLALIEMRHASFMELEDCDYEKDYVCKLAKKEMISRISFSRPQS